jgi:hypothetical protein
VAAVPLADVQRFWNDLGPAKRDTFRTHWAQSGESVLDRAGDVAHDAGEIVHDIAKSKIVKGAAKVADAVFFGGEPALSKGLDSVDKSATSIAKKTAAKAVPKSAPRPAPKPLPKPAAAKSAPKPAAFTRKVSASSARSLLAKAQPGLSSAQLTHLVNTTVVLELAK